MPDPTLPHLHTLIATAGSNEACDEAVKLVWKSFDADKIGSVDCRDLLVAVKARRMAVAEERRRLEELWEKTPAAADDHGDAWEEGATDGG
jgi:hypothetical protein